MKFFKYYINNKIIAVVIIFIFFIILGASLFENRYQFTQNPIGLRVLANWHSLRKVVNLIHLPYWFKETDLDVYNITISPNNYNEMLENIPVSDDGLSYGTMHDEDKHYVKAEFCDKDSNYCDEIKIRYRGAIENNWNAEKRAYRIKFSKSNLFEGQKALNLILPCDRVFFGEVLNSYRADKLGLFSASFKFVKVYVNGKSAGVYLASEPWSKELLAKEKISDTNKVYSTTDSGLSIFRDVENVEIVWKNYIDEESDFEDLIFLEKIMKLDDGDFEKYISGIVEIDQVLKWQLINLLSSSNHQRDNGNTVLLFRKETGKFEPILWDVGLTSPENYNILKSNSLAERILSVDKFFKEFQGMVRTHIENEDNLEDDLRYYDEMYVEMKKEFYNDQAKLSNDMMFDRAIRNVRKNITNNYENAKKILEFSESPFVYEVDKGKGVTTDEIFQNNFSRYKELFISIDEFLDQNRQFGKIDDSTIALMAGEYNIGDKLIIPIGLKLLIEPGVKIRMGLNASIVSYSPVEAMGTKGSPIVISSVDEKSDPWGVFAVINTDNEKSVFEYLEVSGGSSEFLNGVFFTSQFSLHNTIAEIKHSSFSNSKSDDAFHAILGSVDIENCDFSNNFADGIDLDFVSNSSIVNSVFKNETKEDSNGDAIDTSGVVDMIIDDVFIEGYGDKCISAGEASELSVKNSELRKCSIGIAVKDNSFAKIENIKLIDNNTGLSLYRKKPEFIYGGKVELNEIVFKNNQTDLVVDDFSTVLNKK